MMMTRAWTACDPVERALLIEVMARWVGPQSNNGEIPYSVREAAVALNVGKNAAARAFHGLEEKGFLVATTKGGFNWKGGRATRWLVPMCSDDRRLGAKPLRTFASWEPPVNEQATRTEKSKPRSHTRTK